MLVISTGSPFVLRIPVSAIIRSDPVLLAPPRGLSSVQWHRSVPTFQAAGCIDRLLILTQLRMHTRLCVGTHQYLASRVYDRPLMHRLLPSVAQVIRTHCIRDLLLLLWNKVVLFLIRAAIWFRTDASSDWSVLLVLRLTFGLLFL